VPAWITEVEVAESSANRKEVPHFLSQARGFEWLSPMGRHRGSSQNFLFYFTSPWSTI